MANQFTLLMAIFVGGGLGAVARWLTREYLPLFTGHDFPWSTLLVNVLGCFLAGWLYSYWQASTSWPPLLRSAISVGFLGALTTYSTFALDTLHLTHQAEWLKMFGHVAFNLCGSLLAVFLGAWLGARMSAS